MHDTIFADGADLGRTQASGRDTRMMRAVVVPSALAFIVLTALAACAPGPAGPVNAQQQQTLSGCGGDQGMATQFYQSLNGEPRMGPPPAKCP